MKDNTMNQNAMIAIVIGAILILAGGYQAVNPVLAVSAHDDRADVQRMLATATFTMEGFNPTVTISDTPSGSIQEGTPIDITCIWDCDGMPNIKSVVLMHRKPSLMRIGTVESPANTGSHTFSTLAPHVAADTAGSFVCVLADLSDNTVATDYSSEYIITDTPISPAQIDDTTDTLTTGETTYRPGETVIMSAWGENIGEQEWYDGRVEFRVTVPFDSLVAQETDINVAAGSSYTATGTWTTPSDAIAGTYTLQSMWIDEDGNVHAMSTIDLGTETIWGYDISVFGVLIALIGLLIVGYGFSKRKS